MLVTEAEAQRKWCPYGHQPLYTGSNIIAGNRQPNGDVPSCLGSLCMFWRWGEAKQLREIDPVTNETIDEQPRRGYCSAAGKPEYGE